jgi:hypothetical protein
MDRKARENLDAARHLLELEEPCSNAAATRAYYAAYHAVWARLQELGEQVPEVRPGARYFPHRPSKDLESIGDTAERLGALADAEIADLEILWAYRVKADYKPDDVVDAEARECIRASDRIVQRLSGGEGME